MREEQKDSEEVSERDGFEDIHIVRFEQDMVVMKFPVAQARDQREEKRDLAAVLASALSFFSC